MEVHWIDSITLKVIKDVGNCAKNLRPVTIGDTIGITKNVRGSNKNQEVIIVIKTTFLVQNTAAVSCLNISHLSLSKNTLIFYVYL